MPSVLPEKPPEELTSKNLPRHVAIIMDGNRRWAKRHGVPDAIGHWKGAEALSNIVEIAASLGVKVLTVYSFSTENWKRDSQEVEALMNLFKMYLSNEKSRMVDKGVKLSTIGDVNKLPLDLQVVLQDTKEATKAGDAINLVLALNYGGRDDLRRAFILLLKEYKEGRVSLEEISEKKISQCLDTAPWQDPQLLIRTSGESRISNFLNWQISYSEVYITEVLWPDFGEKEFLEALLEFDRRERRLGV
mgnify:CR=1 FL=1